MTGPIPAELAELVADLERDTSRTPTVEEVPGTGRRWLLTHRNDRVTMTLLCRPAKRGRYTWLNSTLTVDGEPRQVADSYEDFVRIFNDPDETPPERPIPEPLPACDPDNLPPMVASTYRRLAESLAGDRITVGHDRNTWVIDLADPSGNAFLRLEFRRYHRGKPVGDMRILLIVEGRDRSREVHGNLAAAVALMARQATPNTGPAPGNSGQEATAGQGFGSVGVRRHSVIRN